MSKPGVPVADKPDEIDVEADSLEPGTTDAPPPDSDEKPAPDPERSKKRGRAFARKVIQNNRPPKKIRNIPMTHTESPAGQKRQPAETASNLFCLSRQLYADGRPAEAFGLFQRAMDSMEMATEEAGAVVSATIKRAVHQLLASAFDPNTGALIAASARPLDVELEVAAAMAAAGKADEADTASAGDAALASLTARLKRGA